MNSRNSNPQGDSKLSANFWNNQAGDVSSRCRVLYRLRKSNIYKIFFSETFISFSITIFLKCENLRNIRIRICSYYFFKKSLIEDCFILSKILWLILFETFRSKGSRSKSVVNSVNLFRISIASSTFRDGEDMGSSGTSSSSLLPIFNGFNKLWKVFANNFVNRQWSRFAGHCLSFRINEPICI